MIPLRWSRSRLREGQNQNQMNFSPAFGHLRSNASGSSTPGRLAARSLACNPRNRLRWSFKGCSSCGGIMVSRLFPPLPNCTAICNRSRSTSFTRRRSSSDNRSPAAYINSAIKRYVPPIASNNALHSACVNTEGTFRPRRARVKSLKLPGSRFSTSRNKKTTAFNAWLWVDALTRSRTARRDNHSWISR